jgi:16S rRNA processing protein RimM
MATMDQDPSSEKQPSGQEAERHPAPDKSAYLFFGKLGKAHGLQGDIILHPFNPGTEEIQPGLKLYIWNAHEGSRQITVESVQRKDKKGRAAVRLTGLKSRAQAEALRGDHVYLPWDSLEQPEGKDFYYAQLKGFEVVDLQGETLGTIAGVFEGATDIFVVRTRGEEILIPATKEIVHAIELDHKRIRVDLPDDLRPKSASRTARPEPSDREQNSADRDDSRS